MAKAPGTGKKERPRTLRKDRTGANPFLVGFIVLVLVGIVCWFGFTKDWPFSRGFQFKAVFRTSNSIRTNSPVRIAGVNVGKVVKIEGQDGTNNAVITMEMKETALPIHKDARLKIRPRIFLEGNFFVDLQPGTPDAATISDGDTVPVAQTAGPVQIDQLLTSLQQDTRAQLQTTLQEFGTSLVMKPTPAEDAVQSPLVRGKSAAQALNQAITYGEPALKGTAIVNQALRGLREDDLSNLVRGLAATGTKLAESQDALGPLVENFNTTMAALAAEQAPLRESIALLGPTVKNAYASLGSLNSALPNVRAFSLELIPGVEQTQPTIDAVTPWIAPTQKLVSQEVLGNLLADLQPATASLARVTTDSVPLLKQGDLLATCVSKVILPTGDVVLDDGEFSTGKANYKEFWYTMVGLAGEGQNFDGNGQYVRFQSGGGGYPVGLAGGNLNNGLPLYGNSVGKPLGTKPAWPGANKKPPYNFKATCAKQPLPDFENTPVGPSDAVAR